MERDTNTQVWASSFAVKPKQAEEVIGATVVGDLYISLSDNIS